MKRSLPKFSVDHLDTDGFLFADESFDFNNIEDAQRQFKCIKEKLMIGEHVQIWERRLNDDDLHCVEQFTKTEISIIREVIGRYNEMVRLYPDKNTFYFSEKSKKDILKRELASAKFYMYCHNADAYGCFEIYELLINKLLPEDIVKNWVETNNGGSVDNDIINVIYGFKPTFECELANTLEEAFENTQYCSSDEEYKIFFSKYINLKQNA